MKKAIQLGISAVAAVALLCGCSEEWGVNSSRGAGRIAPMVGIDTEAVSSRAADASSRTEAEDITASDLSLRLSKDDGSYAETWSSVAEFPLDKNFAVGSYTLDVFYGDPKEEGFEMPAFAGSTQLAIVDGRTTEVGLTAAMANARFIIKYTDAFQGYMNSWKATVQGVGVPIDYAAEETRPVYVHPGEVKISISVTKPNGLSATFALDPVTAEARHEYVLTVDVNNGNVGDATMTVSFDDNLAVEDVELDISDKVLSSPAPTAEASGFTPGTPIEIVSGLPVDYTLTMNLIAQAKLGQVLLETKSETLLAQGWPESLDLLKADASAQAVLTGLGLRVLGLWNKPDQMAVVDFSDVLPNIKAVAGDNTTAFTLTLKDKLMRQSEPLTLTVATEGVRVEIEPVSPYFSPGDPVELKVSFNGGLTALKERVQFMCFDPNAGKFRAAEVLSVEQVASRAMNDYNVSLNAPDFEGTLRVYAVCGDTRSAEISLDLAPFEVACTEDDTYATHAYVKVVGTGTEPAPDINTVSWYGYSEADGAYVALESSVEGEYAHIKGLTPGGKARVKAAFDGIRTRAASLATEQAAVVPNGDFEDLETSADLQFTDMNASGQWSISRGINYQNTMTYSISEPTGWATVNAKTASKQANPQNSLFVVPSTFNTTGKYTGMYPTIMTYSRNESTPASYQGFAAQHGSNAMVVRNVGWDHAGSVPALYYKLFSTDYYNKNSFSVANRSAGKLFLGSYSYAGGTETYNEGVAFGSRPASLSGYYRYSRSGSDSAEKGTVTIALLNGDEVISTTTATFDPAADYTPFTVQLPYGQGTPKATSLRIMFASSDHASYNQADETASIKTDNKLGRYEAYSVGATLVIDNLTFNY